MILSAFTLAAAVLLQPESPPEPQEPLRDETPLERELTPGHDLFYEDEGRGRGPGRRAMHEFGQCVADRSTALAGETLAMDFTTARYRRRMLQLAQNNSGCMRQRGRLRSAPLGMAGAMAERLISRDPVPLNVRLARAAQGAPARSYSPADRVAMCVVRSVPDQVGALLTSEIETPQEAAAAQALDPVFAACNQDRVPFTASVAGARAILATAAYRSLHAGAAAPLNRD